MKKQKDIQVKQDDELVSPLLNQFKKDNVFGTPENYFNEFPQIISKAISSPSEPGVFSRVFSPKFELVSVMVVLLAILGGLYFATEIRTPVETQQALLYEDIESSEIIEQLNDELLYEYYLHDDTSSEPIDPFDADFNQYQNFLLEDNIDVTLIINEL